MADELRIGLAKLLCKAKMDQDADFLKEGVRVLSQALMEMEVEEHIGGASRHERSPGRVGLSATATAGALLGYEGRHSRAEGAEGKRRRLLPLAAGAKKAGRESPGSSGPRSVYVHGVCTRKVDEELVKALGMSGISKSRVSELCEELDEEVERFRGRPLEGSYPYVWVDATYLNYLPQGPPGWQGELHGSGHSRGGERNERRARGFGTRRRSERGRSIVDLVFALFGRPRSLGS